MVKSTKRQINDNIGFWTKKTAFRLSVMPFFYLCPTKKQTGYL